MNSPIPKEVEDLLKAAEQALNTLNGHLDNTPRTSSDVAANMPRWKTTATAQHNLLDIARQLHGTENQQNEALALLKTAALPPEGSSLTPLEHARQTILEDLKEQTVKAKKIGESLAETNSYWQNPTTTESLVAEGPQKFGDGFLGKIIDKHEQFLDGASTGKFAMVGLAEIALGVMVMHKGGQWLNQGLHGIRPKAVALTNIADEKNPADASAPLAPGLPVNSSGLNLVYEPIPPVERVLKTVIGGVTVATGLFAEFAGIVTLSRGFNR